ncbi:FecCD family ABC transporter permease [Holophaga foetida]|uniref:FecCD family ABC transporter permease n=1 Tax=Holophaga foetida TaxID=35839 RepID=UPI0002474683|nr:iron ABC transporter permease [Holophaga foetida]
MKRLSPGLFAALAIPVVLASLFVGPSDLVQARHIAQALTHPFSLPGDETLAMAREILLQVRLPRVLLAFLVGGALTTSGLSLQALVRNPLVSPDILGLSSGAACGAALALALPGIPLQPASFLGGLLAAGASYLLALNRRGLSILSLVLSGIIVGGVCTAILTLIQVWVDPFKLQTIVHWTMGNLHLASWEKLRSAAPLILLGLAGLYFMRWRMNVLALGDEETRAVGLNPEREKLFVLLPATLVASASVAVAGIIGLVGLAVPHMVRMAVGPDNTRAVPASFLAGGIFLVLVDDLARAITTFELPVGIFTTLIGGPFFIYLLKRSGAAFGE